MLSGAINSWASAAFLEFIQIHPTIAMNLYRVCHVNCKTQRTHYSNDFYREAIALRTCAMLNIRWGDRYKFFIEPVDVASLSERLILSLYREGKLSKTIVEDVLGHSLSTSRR